MTFGGTLVITLNTISIGGDMRRFALEMQGSTLEAYSAELVGLLNQAIVSLLRLPQPVVGAVHGTVAGGAQHVERGPQEGEAEADGGQLHEVRLQAGDDTEPQARQRGERQQREPGGADEHAATDQ